LAEILTCRGKAECTPEEFDTVRRHGIAKFGSKGCKDRIVQKPERDTALFSDSCADGGVGGREKF